MDQQGFTGNDGGPDERAATHNPGSGKAEAKQTAAKQASAVQQPADPIGLLSADHRKVMGLFAAFETASDPLQKSRLAEQICDELIIHTLLEEEIFYPACRGRMQERLLAEAQVEHDGTKSLIVEIKSSSPDDQYFDAEVKVLANSIDHHISEEEKPKEGVFAKAKEAGLNTAELGHQLAERKTVLLREAASGELDLPRTQSFRISSNAGGRQSQLQEDPRARQSGDDDRDYRRSGRYDEDRDRRGPRHGGWYGNREGHAEAARRGRDEREGPARGRLREKEDDDDHRGYSRPDYRERDEYARFLGDDDRDYRRPRRYDEADDGDDRRSHRHDADDNRRGRGRGGWHGGG